MIDQRAQPVIHEPFGLRLDAIISEKAKQSNFIDPPNGTGIRRLAMENARLLGLRKPVRQAVEIKQTMTDARNKPQPGKVLGEFAMQLTQEISDTAPFQPVSRVEDKNR